MKRFLKCFACALLLIVIPFVFAGCDADEFVSVSRVVFYTRSVELGVGESSDLNVKVYPVNASNKKLNYVSSNPADVSVNADGKITMHTTNGAYITVTTQDGAKTSVCEVKPKIEPQKFWIVDIDSEIQIHDIYSDPEEDFSVNDYYFTDGAGNTISEATLNNTEIEISVGQVKKIKLICYPSIANSEKLSLAVTNNVDALGVVSSKNKLIKGLSSIATGEIQEGEVSATAGLAKLTGTIIRVSGAPIIKIVNVRVIDPAVAVFVYDGALFQEDAGINDGSNINCSIGVSKILNVTVLSNVDSLRILRNNIVEIKSSNEDIFTVSEVTGEGIYIPTVDGVRIIKINPVSTGTAYLTITSDAVDGNGNPIIYRLKIFVDNEINKVDVGIDRDAGEDRYIELGGKKIPVITEGETFSLKLTYYTQNTDASYSRISVNASLDIKYIIYGGSYAGLYDDDAVYVQYTGKVQSGEEYYTRVNRFKAQEAKGTTITIQIEIDGVTLDGNSGVFEFFVRPKLEKLEVSYNGDEVSEIRNISVGERIEIFARTHGASLNEIIAPVDVVVSGYNFDEEDIDGNIYTLNPNAGGIYTIRFEASDGIVTLIRTVTVYVNEKVADLDVKIDGVSIVEGETYGIDANGINFNFVLTDRAGDDITIENPNGYNVEFRVEDSDGSIYSFGPETPGGGGGRDIKLTITGNWASFKLIVTCRELGVSAEYNFYYEPPV